MFKRFKYTRNLCYIGTGDAGGDGGGSGGVSGEGTGDGGDGAGAGEGGGEQKVERPEYVPEKFWDAETNTVKTEDAFKSYTELEGKLGKSSEELETSIREKIAGEVPEGMPASADKYEAVAPDLGLPEGYEITVSDDDPRMKMWRETAFKNKLTNEEFNAGVKSFFEHEWGLIQDAADAKNQLGENGADRINRVDGWIKANLDDDGYRDLTSEIMSAKGVEALEKLMDKLDPDFKPPVSDGGSAGGITLEKLQEMQQDPRYRDPRKREPEFVRQVEEGFKTLYK